MSAPIQVISVSAITLLLAVVLYFAVIFADNLLHSLANESSRDALSPYGPNAYVARIIMRRGLRRFILSWFRLVRMPRGESRIQGVISSLLRASAFLFLPVGWWLVVSYVVFVIFKGGWSVVGLISDSLVTLETDSPPSEVLVFTALWGIFGYVGFFFYASNPDGWSILRMLPRYQRELGSIGWRPRLISMQMSYLNLFRNFVTPIYVGFMALDFALRVQVQGEPWGQEVLLLAIAAILLLFAVASRARRTFLKVGVLKSLEELLYMLDSKYSANPDSRSWIYLPSTRREALYAVVVNIELMTKKSPYSFIGDIAEPRYVLLRAIAKEFRNHIGSLNSLEADFPEMQERLVRLTYVAMIETENIGISYKLNEIVNAFDENGIPNEVAEYPRMSRFIERIEIATRILDFGDKIYQSSRLLIMLVVVGVLVALGSIGEGTILRILGIQ